MAGTQDLLEWLERQIGNDPEIYWDKDEFNKWAQQQIIDYNKTRKKKIELNRHGLTKSGNQRKWREYLQEKDNIDLDGTANAFVENVEKKPLSKSVDYAGMTPDELKVEILSKIFNKSTARKLSDSSGFVLSSELNEAVEKVKNQLDNLIEKRIDISNAINIVISNINKMDDYTFKHFADSSNKKNIKEDILSASGVPKNIIKKISEIPPINKNIDHEIGKIMDEIKSRKSLEIIEDIEVGAVVKSIEKELEFHKKIEKGVRDRVSVKDWQRKYASKSPEELMNSYRALKGWEKRRKKKIEEMLKSRGISISP